MGGAPLATVATTKLTELLEEFRGGMNRIQSLEKAVQVLGRPQSGGGVDFAAIKKAMVAGAAGTAGFDGADELQLLRAVAGPRQKMIGCGTYLRALFVAQGGAPGVAGWGGRQEENVGVHKYLDNVKSRLVSKTALAEGSGVLGGYTVPVQFYTELMRLVAEASFVAQLCTTIPMTSRSMLIPALTQSAAPAAGTSAYFGGIASSFQPENSTLPETEPRFRQIELVARDQVYTTVASNQLLQDNAVALDTLLSTIFSEHMGWTQDYYILRGNGVNQPLGVLNAPATYQQPRATSNVFKLVDAANMLAHLWSGSWADAVWVMHPSVLPQLVTMEGGTGSNLVWVNQYPGGNQGGGAALKLPMTLFGLPIYFTEKLPQLGSTGDVLLADFSKYIIGDRLAMQVETSTHARFFNNQTVWRVIRRWDGQPWLDAPVISADGAGTYKVSPFVALKAETS